MSGDLFDQLDTAFDSEQREKFWELYGGLGVPFTLFAALAAFVLWLLQYRLDRVRSLAVAFGAVNSKRRLAIAFWVISFLLVFPLLWLLAWGWSVAAEINPPLVGVSLITVWPAALIGVYALFLWRARGWRASPTSTRMSVVQACVLVAFVLLVGFELAVLYNGDYLIPDSGVDKYEYSFVGSSWVWLGLNTLFVTMSLSIMYAPPEKVSVRSLIRAFLFKSNLESSDAGAPRMPESAVGGAVPPVGEQSLPPSPSSTVVSTLCGGKRTAAVSYIISLVLLLTYALLNFELADNDEDSGKYLGFTTAGSVLILDVCMWAMRYGKTLSSLGTILAFVSVSRVGLVAFGATYWLLGTSSMYLLFAGWLAHITARRVYASLRWGFKPSGHGGSTASASDVAPPHPVSKWSRLGAVVQHPAAILAFLTLTFGVFVLAVERNDSSNLPRRRVPAFEGTQPQYAYAVGAICGIAILLTGEFAVRSYFYHGRHMRKTTAGLVALCEFVILASGITLYGITESYIVLAVAVFVPPLMFLCLAGLSRWRQDDYDAWLPGGVWVPFVSQETTAAPVSPSGAAPAAAAGAAGAGGQSPTAAPGSPSRFGNSVVPTLVANPDDDRRRNTTVLLIGVTILGCIIGFGAVSAAGFDNAFVGWTIACAMFIVLATLMVLTEWFNTFTVSKFMIGTFIAAVVIHVVCHGVLLAQYDADDGKSRSGVAFSFVVYPALVCLLSALYRYWDDKWHLSRFVIVAYTVSQVIIVGFAIAGAIVWDDNTVAVLAALGAYVYINLLGIVGLKWVAHGFSLPKRWRVGAWVAVGFVFAIGVIVCIARASDGKYSEAVSWFSFAYLIVVLTLLVVSVSKMGLCTRRGTRNTPGTNAPVSRVYFSEGIFPVYYYSLETDSLKQANAGPGLLFTSSALVMVWGTAAAVFLSPSYVGIIVLVSTKVATLQYVLHVLRRSHAELAEACSTLRQAQRFNAALSETAKAALGVVAQSGSSVTQADAVVSSESKREFGGGSETPTIRVGGGTPQATYDGLFKGHVTRRRIAALEALEKQLAGGWCGAPGADAAAPTRSLSHTRSASDLLANANSKCSCVSVRNSLPPMTGPDGCRVVANINTLSDAERQEWANGGFSGADASFARLKFILQELRWLDAITSRFAREEAWFRVVVRNGLIVSAANEASRAYSEWSAFLAWCSTAPAQAVLARHNMDLLNTLHHELCVEVDRGVAQDFYLLGEAQLVAHWEAALGPQAATAQGRQLHAVQQEYANFKHQEEENFRRREQEDVEAERQRQREMERIMEERRRAQHAEEERRKHHEEEARRARQEAQRRLAAEAEEQRRRMQAEEEARQREMRELEEERRRAAREQEEATRRRREAELAERARRMEEKHRQEEARRQAELQRIADQERRALEEEEARRKEEEASLKAAAASRRSMGDTSDATQMALSLVQQYRAEARRTRSKKFVDDSFFGVDAIGRGLAAKSGDRWEHVDKICADPYVRDVYNPRDIVQGVLGDCWLLSAMSVAATHPKLLDKCIVTKEANPEGVYAVQFYKNGTWIPIIVDDRFPVQSDAFYDYKDKSLYAGDYSRSSSRYASPSFVSSSNHNELWMMLLEKAYAKFYSSYEAIEGGLVHLALVDLTGGSSEIIKMTNAAVAQDIKTGALWARVRRYTQLGYLLGAGSHAGKDTDVNDLGIVQGHAYAVLRAVEESDSRGTHQLLQLRNPWGRTEWQGAWSDKDRSRWTKRMQQKLGYDPSTEDHDDGVFWISFQDFTLNFRNIYVCRLFDTSDGKWFKYTAAGEWSRAKRTAGGCPNEDSCDQNPHYYLETTEPTTVFVSLAQSEEMGTGRDNVIPIGFKVLDKLGERVKNVYQGEQVMGGAYAVSREVSAEATLSADKVFTLFASTFRAGAETAYTLTVYSDRPLANTSGTKLRRIPDSVRAS